MQDFKYAARLLIRSPASTLVALAALALGIGANTAIFSVVDTLLLRPLPYANPSRLAVVWEHNIPRDRKNNVVSPGNFIHWREMNQSFQDLAAVSMTFRTTLTGAGDATELPVQYVSGTLFGILGVRPEIGRDFTPQEDAPGVRAVAVSDRLRPWRNAGSRCCCSRSSRSWRSRSLRLVSTASSVIQCHSARRKSGFAWPWVLSAQLSCV